MIDATDGAGNNFNDGVLQASNGATLVLLNHSLDCTNGDIQALDNSVVTLQGVFIENPRFVTVGTGRIQTTNSIPVVQNAVNDGLLRLPNDGDLTILGTFVNNDTIEMNSLGNLTDISLNSDVTLSGPGEVVMSNNIQNRWFGINANRRLTHAADHTIRGSGQIEPNSGFLYTNHGLIDANQSNSITIDATTAPA